MIILLLGTHVFLTIRLRVPQRKLITGIRLSVKKDDSASGDVSQFGALATALAATIGTGNIVGVATAVALGGPGAVLWCWLTGIFGMSTKYAEGLLAVKYRVRAKDGHTYGGPMYALERGLNMKWLAVLFAVFTALASFGIGCTVQANSIALLASETFGIPAWVVGVFVSVLAGCVILGGVKAIAKVCPLQTRSFEPRGGAPSRTRFAGAGKDCPRKNGRRYHENTPLPCCPLRPARYFQASSWP